MCIQTPAAAIEYPLGRECTFNILLWLWYHLNGRSDGPGPINRLVMPCPSGYPSNLCLSTCLSVLKYFLQVIYYIKCLSKSIIIGNPEEGGGLWVNWVVRFQSVPDSYAPLEYTILGTPGAFWWRSLESKHRPSWHSVAGGWQGWWIFLLISWHNQTL